MSSAWADVPSQAFRVPRRLMSDYGYVVEEHPPPSPDDAHRSFQISGPCQLRVLTQNMFAVPLKPHVTERVEGFSKQLATYDLAAFQEVVHAKERDILISAGRQRGLMFSHHFDCGIGFPGYPGCWGTGLVVLSRFPIVETMFQRYSSNGKPYKIHQADYLAGKGCGLLRILTPGGMVDVYVTHLIAFYTVDPRKHPQLHDEYHVQRILQSFEMAQFVRSTARSPLVLLMGDFNSEAESVCTRLVREYCALQDPHAERDEVTYMGKDNTYYCVDGDASLRIDYLMFSATKEWRVKSCGVVKDYVDIDGATTSISDHFGVTCTFERLDPDHGPLVSRDPTPLALDCSASLTKLLTTAVKQLELGMEESKERQKGHLKQAMICFVLCLLLAWFAPFAEWLDVVLAALLASYAAGQLVFGFVTTMDERSAFTEALEGIRQALRMKETMDVLNLHSGSAQELSHEARRWERPEPPSGDSGA